MRHEKSGFDDRHYILSINICGRRVCAYQSRAGKRGIRGDSGYMVHDLLGLLPRQEVKQIPFSKVKRRAAKTMLTIWALLERQAGSTVEERQ